MNPGDVLRRYPLFAVLDRAWLEAWVASGESIAAEMGQTVFQAGTPGHHAYLIQSGRVRILRPGNKVTEVSFGGLGPGDVFGEYALVPPGLQHRHLPGQRTEPPPPVTPGAAAEGRRGPARPGGPPEALDATARPA